MIRFILQERSSEIKLIYFILIFFLFFSGHYFDFLYRFHVVSGPFLEDYVVLEAQLEKEDLVLEEMVEDGPVMLENFVVKLLNYFLIHFSFFSDNSLL